MNTIKVKIENKTIEISKLPLGKYANLLESIEELPKHISGLDKVDNETILANLPKLISKSLPDIVRIVNIATDEPEEEILTWGLADLTDVIVAIMEVNRYKDVFDGLKKAFARPNQIKVIE